MNVHRSPIVYAIFQHKRLVCRNRPFALRRASQTSPGSFPLRKVHGHIALSANMCASRYTSKRVHHDTCLYSATDCSRLQPPRVENNVWNYTPAAAWKCAQSLRIFASRKNRRACLEIKLETKIDISSGHKFKSACNSFPGFALRITLRKSLPRREFFIRSTPNDVRASASIKTESSPVISRR
jgi:hypothetical protein